jgi:hypothetical protein
MTIFAGIYTQPDMWASFSSNPFSAGLRPLDAAKVNPDLVARDAKGEPYTVRYEAVNAMLLNEFLKEHCPVQEQSRKAEEQERTISQLESTVAQQQKDFQAAAAHQQEQIEALAAGLRRVSGQIGKGGSARSKDCRHDTGLGCGNLCGATPAATGN